MTPSFSTPQEEFWAGAFGTEYASRNADATLLASNIAFFARILGRSPGIDSVIEFGANIGMNMRALRSLRPNASLAGVELNADAAAELGKIPGVIAHHDSLLEFRTADRFDLTFTKGVLIHINPDLLPKAYETLYTHSRRYIIVAEYYNPTPVAIPYRGHADRLFKRDFAGEMLEKYPDLQLVDYGFAYKRDQVHPQDDITWFLLEKR